MIPCVGGVPQIKSEDTVRAKVLFLTQTTSPLHSSINTRSQDQNDHFVEILQVHCVVNVTKKVLIVDSTTGVSMGFFLTCSKEKRRIVVMLWIFLLCNFNLIRIRLSTFFEGLFFLRKGYK